MDPKYKKLLYNSANFTGTDQISGVVLFQSYTWHILTYIPYTSVSVPNGENRCVLQTIQIIRHEWNC